MLGAAGHVPVAARMAGRADGTEVDVLRLLARGLSTKEIAAHLVISPKTARNHVEHIYAKAAVTNPAQASVFAMRHGLLSDQEMLISSQHELTKMGQVPQVRNCRPS